MWISISVLIIVFLLVITAILISVIQEWNKKWKSLNKIVDEKITEHKNYERSVDRVSVINFEYVRDMMNIIKKG